MKIKHDIDFSDWQAFVDSHPKGNIFQSPSMYRVFEKTKNQAPVFMAVVEGDEILGVILGSIHKEFSGLLGRMTSRSIIIGGPLIKDDRPDVLRLLLQKYSVKVKSKTIFTQVRNLWEWGDLKTIFDENGFKYDPHLDILIDISSSREEIWSSLKSKARNKIRKAEKSQLKFDVINPKQKDIKRIYKILLEVYKKAKIPLSDMSLFESAFDVLGEKDQIKLFVALKNDKIIGFRIGLLFKETIFDWYAGSFEKYYQDNPNDFLPFETMAWGSQNGYKLFDFGGAGKPNQPYGVRDHKLKFGGDLVEFGRFEKVHKSFLMEIAKIGLQIYKKVK